jgi:hypothetical protein
MPADQSILDLGRAVPDPAVRSRRAVLAAATGAAGAVLATLARPLQVDAGAGDPVRIGRANKGAGTNTTLTTSTDSGAAFRAVQNGAGAGVRGISIDGTGVAGASENWVGVGGTSENGFAIWGESTNNYAGFFVNQVYLGGWIDVEEITPPGAAGENQARLYVWDDNGKTTLSVAFPDGSSVDLAAEA